MSAGRARRRKAINYLRSWPPRPIDRGFTLHVEFKSKSVVFESDVRVDSESCVQQERATVAAANDTPDIEELGGMLIRGEFPPNYDTIIRNISDEDLERLWAYFKHKRRTTSEGGDDPPAQTA
jgi:hypothetical protein